MCFSQKEKSVTVPVLVDGDVSSSLKVLADCAIYSREAE